MVYFYGCWSKDETGHYLYDQRGHQPDHFGEALMPGKTTFQKIFDIQIVLYWCEALEEGVCRLY